jgi:flagellar protein FlgJ
MQATGSPDIYTDFSALTALRRDARKNPEAALRKVAKQFESMYIKMMLKSMRQASMGDPLFDSDAAKMYRSMFDNQLAIDLSNHGGFGLAKMLMQQLQHYIPGQHPHGNQISRISPAIHPEPQVHTKAQVSPVRFKSKQQFVETVWPLAKQAAKALNVPAKAILAQAALESGWGRHVSQSAGGINSHNLFNIKADDGWRGPKVIVDTLEFEHGVAKRQKAAFRAYASYADCFHDYVKFLKSNPRYQQALAESKSAEDFARKLHQAGYATDPAYADKLIDIMQRNVPASSATPLLAAS